MIGRLYRHLENREVVFWHAFSASEQGLQIVGDSCGGIDTAAVSYLLSLNIPHTHIAIAWHKTSNPPRKQHVATLAKLLEYATFKDYGGRFRLFLPDHFKHDEFWDIPKVYLPRLELEPVRFDPRRVKTTVVVPPVVPVKPPDGTQGVLL